jgi:hypothetical protein
MKPIISIIIAIVLCAAAASIGQPAPERIALPAGSRFEIIDVFVDSGKELLAAWQVEFKATAGQVEIVGIERGDNAGFQDPPYYDPAAIQKNRIVIGAFNLTNNLPVGKTKIARLHLHVSGAQKPTYAAKVIVAGNKEGKPIAASASVGEVSPESKNKPEGDPK